MSMRFLFYLGHPAHYHNLRHSVRLLSEKGHSVKVVARGKDVLFDLIDREKWDLEKLPERKSGGGKLGLAANIAARELTMLRLVRKYKPNLLVGTDLVIAHIGKITGIPSIIINEDDSAAVPLMAKYAFPYCTAILAPNCCDQSPANHKKIGYEGHHELAYLHPNIFHSVRADLPEKLRTAERYFILRFASLHAHHDAGRKGISDELALELIDLLEPHGQVYITSERALAEELEPFRLRVHPSEMHHVMAHADLYIGDSQTMAAEAAVLGVPSIRFNDFVGELAYLEELEHKYSLTRGIKTDDPKALLALAKAWATDPELKAKFQTRRKTMLDATIEVTPFWVETFEAFAQKIR
jgi:predicted glycosyltransferase